MAELNVLAETDELFCTVHPKVATTLRCNKCGRPMCLKCAVRTPVGYRCKECVRGQQEVFYNATSIDPIIQGALSVVLSGIAAALISFIGGGIGFFGLFITFVAGSAAGALISDLAHRAAGKRRSRYSWMVVAGGIALGGLLALPILFLSGNILGWLIYMGTAVMAAVGRLRMGR